MFSTEPRSHKVRGDPTSCLGDRVHGPPASSGSRPPPDRRPDARQHEQLARRLSSEFSRDPVTSSPQRACLLTTRNPSTSSWRPCAAARMVLNNLEVLGAQTRRIGLGLHADRADLSTRSSRIDRRLPAHPRPRPDTGGFELRGLENASVSRPWSPHLAQGFAQCWVRERPPLGVAFLPRKRAIGILTLRALIRRWGDRRHGGAIATGHRLDALARRGLAHDT